MKSKLIRTYYDDDNEEINIYEYREKKIYENSFHENEFSIDDEWFYSLDEAEKYIDKDINYNALSDEDKKFIDDFRNKPFCSYLNDKCPYENECCNNKECKIKEALNSTKEKMRHIRSKYNNLLENSNEKNNYD